MRVRISNTVNSFLIVKPVCRLVCILLGLLHYSNVQAGSDLPDSLQTLLNRATSDSARIIAHNRIANALLTSDYRHAMEHSISAVQMSEEYGSYDLKIMSYVTAGSVSMYKGLFDHAVNFFNRHYELAKSAGETMESGKAYFNLGSVYLSLKNYSKAGKVFDEALQMLEKGCASNGEELPPLTVITYRMNRAICYLYQPDFRRCDSILDLVQPMIEGVAGMESKLLSLHHIRALMEFNIQRPAVSMKYLNRARQMAISLNDQPSLSAICMTEGECYVLLGDFKAAIRAYTEGLANARSSNGTILMAHFSELLYKQYQKNGPADSIVKYFNLYTDLQKQTRSEEAKEALMRADFKRSYDQMLKDLTDKDKKSQRQQLLLTIALVLVSFVVIIAYLQYHNRSRKMRFEQVRRDMEERKARYEQLRLEAELRDRDAELESLKRELDKYSLIVGLVGSLDSIKQSKLPEKGDIPGSTETSASERREKAWGEFEWRFQQMHSGFYDRLSQQYPSLTMNERRLCAFLLLDMTTKEISAITGQSVTALYMARIRIRNKLGLTHTDKELYKFLSEL